LLRRWDRRRRNRKHRRPQAAAGKSGGETGDDGDSRAGDHIQNPRAEAHSGNREYQEAVKKKS